ncbi:MAG: GNAT family N-acetyltransferase, partial [Anaerolineales bacterium]|nr:GNAT family N-acetyltransferase [Anaerolineales bacterium]
MDIVMRLADPDKDYEGIAALWSQLEPEPVTAAQLHEWDMPAPGKLRRRLAAFVDDEIVGYSFVGRDAFDGNGRYEVWVGVAPAWQRQGIGRQLYDELLTFVRQQAAAQIVTSVRDNNPAALRFAQQRGFDVKLQRFESAVHLHNFDVSPFAGIV